MPSPFPGMNPYLENPALWSGERRPKADLYAFNLQNVIPCFPLPLRSEDIELLVDLQILLTELYNRASYDLVIDYSREPVLPLSEEDAAWNDT